VLEMVAGSKVNFWKNQGFCASIALAKLAVDMDGSVVTMPSSLWTGTSVQMGS
jgi:hypothetical protein